MEVTINQNKIVKDVRTGSRGKSKKKILVCATRAADLCKLIINLLEHRKIIPFCQGNEKEQEIKGILRKESYHGSALQTGRVYDNKHMSLLDLSSQLHIKQENIQVCSTIKI